MHMATLPTGLIACIEIPITTVGPSQYGKNDLITLICSLVHLCHPKNFEQFNVQY